MAATKVPPVVKPPGCKRLSIALAVAAYVLLGLPVWWSTTRVPRPDLPHAAMQDADRLFANAGPDLLMPVNIDVYIVAAGSPASIDLGWLPQTVYARLQQLQPPQSAPISQVTVTLEHAGACQHSSMSPLARTATRAQLPPRPSSTPPGLPCLNLAGLFAQTDTSHRATEGASSAVQAARQPADIDRQLQAALMQTSADIAGRYTVFLFPRAWAGPPTADSPTDNRVDAGPQISAEAGGGARVTVGQYRHIWAYADPGEVQGALHATALPALARMLFPQPGAALVRGASQLPTSPTGDTVLLFTLANGPNPLPTPPPTTRVHARRTAAAHASDAGGDPHPDPHADVSSVETQAGAASSRGVAGTDSTAGSGNVNGGRDSGGVATSGAGAAAAQRSSAPPPPVGTDAAGGVPGYVTWQFDRFQRAYVAPLTIALASVVRLHVRSQVRLHMRPGLAPKWNSQQGGFVLRPKHLPAFINSEWSLDMGLDAAVGAAGGEPHSDDTDTGGAGTSAEHIAGQGQGQGQGQGVCAAREEEYALAGEVPAASSTSGTERTSCGAASAGAASRPDDVAARAQPPRHAPTWHVPAHVLHVVLYVPSAVHQPLYVMAPGGRPAGTNSFVVPSWGAVHVLPRAPAAAATSPPDVAGAAVGSLEPHARQTTGDQGDASPVTPAAPPTSFTSAGRELGDDDLHTFAQSVIAELRVLLGLPPGPSLPPSAGGWGTGQHPTHVSSLTASDRTPDPADVLRVLPADAGLAAWEVDGLLRARTAADIAAAARILGSLSRLTQALPTLAMPEVIGAHVADARAALRAALHAVRYSAAAGAARTAHAAAEAAFSHPAILSQLSFPDAHKVGVYMPFFLPALLPVVAGLLSEARRWVRRRREYRAYCAVAAARAAGLADLPPGLSAEQVDLLHLMHTSARSHADADGSVPGVGKSQDTG